jgi:hypothetical protein
MLNLRSILVRSLFGFMAVLAPATAGAQQAPDAASGTQPPVAYASVNELNGMLA